MNNHSDPSVNPPLDEAGKATPSSKGFRQIESPGNNPGRAVQSDNVGKPKPAGGIVISFYDLLSQNGTTLRQTLGRLAKGSGRRVRAAFRIPSFDELNSALTKFLADNKGPSRLRVLIGLGFQCGEYPHDRTSVEGVWSAILEVTDSYLRQIPQPRPPSTSGARGDGLVTSYNELWSGLCKEAEKNASKSGYGVKFFDRAREILLLDAFYSHARGYLDESQFLSAAAVALPSREFADPVDGTLPWSFPAIVSNGGSAISQVNISVSLRSRFEGLSAGLTQAQARISELEESLRLNNQELGETKDALAEEARLLVAANDTIENLRKDVATTGNIHKHKLDDTRARVTGLLEGDLSRHLNTIQTCVSMEPPRVGVANERIDTLQEIIEREIKWLKSSE